MSISDEVRIIQYLGNKMKIIPQLKIVFDNVLEKNELIVDLFAGTGVVGNHLKEEYRIIANDIQEYSYLMNKVLLENNGTVVTRDYSIDLLYQSEAYKKNYEALESLFRRPLSREDKIINENDYESLSKLTESEIFYNNNNYFKDADEKKYLFVEKIYENSMHLFSDDNINSYKQNNKKFPYSLFTIYYLNSYFSLRQCIEIDSLRYAIDCLSDKNYREDELKQILIACLLHSTSEIVSSVGKQFAQPLKTVDKNGDIKDFAIKRCMNDRKKIIKKYMTNMYLRLSSLKLDKTNKNEVYNLDYNELLTALKDKNVGAFYIDPPYTIDHYSRFYHIPETLIKYDYPDLEFKKYKGHQIIMRGRYRTDRFQSNFCIPSKVNNEFHNLIRRVKETNAKLFLSYSDHDEGKNTRKRVISRDELLNIISEYYDKVDVINIEHNYRKLNNQSINKQVKSDSEMLIICT